MRRQLLTERLFPDLLTIVTFLASSLQLPNKLPLQKDKLLTGRVQPFELLRLRSATGRWACRHPRPVIRKPS